MEFSADLDFVDYMEWTAGVYTRLTTGFRRRLDRTQVSMTERRILRKLHKHPDSTDAEIATDLAMARAQLSRALAGLIEKGLVVHQPSSRHRSQRLLQLTDEGSVLTEQLDLDSKDAFAAQFETMTPREQKIIMDAMAAGNVKRRGTRTGEALELREPNVEDLTWLFGQLILYGHRTYGWDHAYSAYIAEQFRAFAENSAYVGQTGWIAYRYGQRAGGCLLVYGHDPLRSGGPDSIHATLSAMIVSSRFRGLGIGSRLLQAAIDQTRELSMLSLLATAAKRQVDLHNLYRKFKLEPRRTTLFDTRFGTADEWRDYVLNLGLRRPGRPRLSDKRE